MRVRVLPEVRGRLGGTVELPCHLLPPTTERVSQVTWQRLDGTVVAAFHPSFGVDFPNSQFNKDRLSFVRAKQEANADLRDATLAFRGLRVEDEGNYTCEFATFPNGTRRGVTWLRVIAQPENHAEAQEVTIGPQSVAVARCISTGAAPLPESPGSHPWVERPEIFRSPDYRLARSLSSVDTPWCRWAERMASRSRAEWNMRAWKSPSCCP